MTYYSMVYYSIVLENALFTVPEIRNKEVLQPTSSKGIILISCIDRHGGSSSKARNTVNIVYCISFSISFSINISHRGGWGVPARDLWFAVLLM